MLTVTIHDVESETDVVLSFEHSLVSLSKWESEHEKAFFGKEPMNAEETVSYVKHMLVGEPPVKNWIDLLQNHHYIEITDYINSRQTATWFRENPNEPKSNEVVTSELIYYWMISFQIPFECETWHLNRLMTLIKICGVKQTKPKKMSKQALAEQYRQLNAQRRQQLGTAG